MILYIILGILILALLLFFPIRVKVTIIYEDNELNVYVFNKLLNLSIFKNPLKKEEKTYEKKVNPRTASRNKKFLERLFEESFKNDIFKGNFRPSIRFNCKMQYGLGDAAITGVAYGLFSNFSYVLYNLIERRLRVKEYKFDIAPHFNNLMLKFRIISIFSLNLAQIIYVLIIIYRK